MKLLALTLLPILMIPSILTAQSATHTPINFGVWAGYDGGHPFNDTTAWRLVLAGTLKRNHGIFAPQADYLEAGIGYEFKDSMEVSAGYAFQYHFPYDSASQPYRWAEDRIWEEANFKFKLSDDKTLRQQFRLEERFEARKNPPNFAGV